MEKLPGFSLALADTPDGPLLATDDPECEALARLINAAIDGTADELPARLERGETITFPGGSVARPSPDTDLATERAEFHEASGQDPEDDFFVVRGDRGDEVLYPRYTLEDMLYELRDVRKEWRAKRDRERRIQERLDRVASLSSYAGFALFCLSPTAGEPAPHEQQTLADAEQQARKLADAERRREALGENPPADQLIPIAAEASAKRRFLHLELHVLGLFSAERADEKRRFLRTWGFTELERFFEAAQELLHYLGSEDRKRYVPDARPLPVLVSPISIDWFRKPEPIPSSVKVGPLHWASWCESQATEQIENSQHEGWFIWHSGNITHAFHWRMDDGEHAFLLRVS